MRTRAAFLMLCGFFVPPHAARAQVPNFDHVVVIVMENQEYGNVIGNPSAPYINSLAQQFGVATNDFAASAPAAPAPDVR